MSLTRPYKSEIVIVDFGGQTAHTIGRRLRELGVSSAFVDPSRAYSFIQKINPSGVILSGGPASVYESGVPSVDKKVFSLGVPVLGICYGVQKMSQLLRGEVLEGTKEYGAQELKIVKKNQLFEGILEDSFPVIMSHGDTVTKLPAGFEVIAKTLTVKFAGVANIKKNLYGVQFHPEVSHTKFGLKILENFVSKICGVTTKALELDPKTLIEKIKEQVGEKKVICAVSGGVDSTVAAFLIGKAIGKNLIPVYVESGLMREGTDKLVERIFSKLIKADLQIIDARIRFLKALKGVDDPEQKRKIIGKLYVEIFAEVARKHKDASFLGQGTIRSDVIESKGSKHASNIKSHHNVGGLPKDLQFSLLEPMREFYKDEVREIGRKLGLPEDIVMQQPFPGPGYAVRIRGEVNAKRLAQVKLADQIVIEEMKKAGLFEESFQCFAIMTGAYSTAVKGDARAFAEVVGIRAYQSDDVMTSQWMYLPEEVLRSMSRRIVNEVPDVSRVVLCRLRYIGNTSEVEFLPEEVIKTDG